MVYLISGLRRNGKQRSEELAKLKISRKDRTIFAPSNLFLKCESYMHCSFYTVRSDHLVQDIVQYETSGQKCSTLFLTNVSSLHVIGIVRNNNAQKRKIIWSLGDCNSAHNPRAKNY